MDSNARKRPRSTTPSESSSPTKKKSKGNKSKTKKSKKNRSNSMVDNAASAAGGSSTTKTKNSMDSTATTDGQIIYQMMSTFSKVELSRFEAFQRASFPVDAVGDWVAACLSHRLNCQQPRQRSLEDLVAVGQAGEIRTVVAVLAKTYAQRLAQAASNLKAQQQQSQPQGAMMMTDSTAQQAPLEPEDIMIAYQKRQAQGQDPGLFLQSANERPGFVVESKESFQQRRLAALEAQEAYEKQQQAQKDKDKDNDSKEGKSDSAMEVEKKS